jgi:hypothetical protein
MIVELEHKTGGGIGVLFDRVARRHFRHVDLIETIRCGLIGGGTAPADAARLIAAYAVDRPLSETLTLADAILEAAFVGVPVAAPANPAPAPPVTEFVTRDAFGCVTFDMDAFIAADREENRP